MARPSSVPAGVFLRREGIWGRLTVLLGAMAVRVRALGARSVGAEGPVCGRGGCQDAGGGLGVWDGPFLSLFLFLFV